MKLKRTVGFGIGGVWGDEPTGGEDDVAIARVADFDYAALTLTDPLQTVRSVPRQQRLTRLLRPGDLLIEKSGGGEQQNVGRAVEWRGHTEAVCSNFMNVLRPAPGHNPRFLTYLHRSLYLRGVAAAATKQTTGIQNLDLTAYLSVDVDVPPLDHQGSVARFLDRECERIATIEATVAAALAVVEEMASSGLAEMMREAAGVDQRGIGSDRMPNGWHRILLSQCLLQLTNGYVGPTRDILVDEGVRYIQSTHIKDGRIDFERRRFFVSPEWFAAHPRIQLRKDDVLIVQTGKLGEIALVPADYGSAACHALLIARTNPSIVSGPYLAAWFRSEFGRAELLRMATGALHPHLEAGEIRKLHMIVPPPPVQSEFVHRDAENRERVGQLKLRIANIRERLTEYRDALITEAVTGQLDVTKISESQLDESARAALEGERPEVLSA